MDEGKVGGVDWGQVASAAAAAVGVGFTLATTGVATKTDIGLAEDRPEVAALHAVGDMFGEHSVARRLGEATVEGAEPVAEPEAAEHSDPPEGSTFFAAEAPEATDQMAADMDMAGDMSDSGPGYA